MISRQWHALLKLEIGRKMQPYIKYLCSRCAVGITKLRCRTLVLTAALKSTIGASHIPYWKRRKDGKSRKQGRQKRTGA